MYHKEGVDDGREEGEGRGKRKSETLHRQTKAKPDRPFYLTLRTKMAHRRRGVGVSRTGAAAYTKKAEEHKAVSLASAMEMVEKLEVKLADFAKRHKHDIQHDPAFRSKFLEMCAPLGRHCILTLILSIGDTICYRFFLSDESFT